VNSTLLQTFERRTWLHLLVGKLPWYVVRRLVLGIAIHLEMGSLEAPGLSLDMYG
jgi:hypothetical protein